MKGQNISPMIRAILTAVSIIALWLGIQEYVEVKTLTQDTCLAVMRMMFISLLVFGSTYIIYVCGYYIAPKLRTRIAVASSAASAIIPKESFDDIVAEQVRMEVENQNNLIQSLTAYTSYSFSKKLSSDQLDILIENIQLLADGKDSSGNVTQKMVGVTSNDLYHFGWNIGKRLKRSNIQIAWFLKDTFKTMLEDVSIDTVQTKLAIKEGNFTLKLIPLDKELIPHVFPDCA